MCINIFECVLWAETITLTKWYKPLANRVSSFLFYRWRIRVTERWSNLHKVTQLISPRAQVQTPAVWLQSLCSWPLCHWTLRCQFCGYPFQEYSIHTQTYILCVKGRKGLKNLNTDCSLPKKVELMASFKRERQELRPLGAKYSPRALYKLIDLTLTETRYLHSEQNGTQSPSVTCGDHTHGKARIWNQVWPTLKHRLFPASQADPELRTDERTSSDPQGLKQKLNSRAAQ